MSDFGWLNLLQVSSFLTLVSIFFFYLFQLNIQVIILKLYVIRAISGVLIAITLFFTFSSVLNIPHFLLKDSFRIFLYL